MENLRGKADEKLYNFKKSSKAARTITENSDEISYERLSKPESDIAKKSIKVKDDENSKKWITCTRNNLVNYTASIVLVLNAHKKNARLKNPAFFTLLYSIYTNSFII